MKKARKKRNTFLGILLLCICAVAVHSVNQYWLLQREKQLEAELQEKKKDTVDYSATEEIEAAKKKLEENPQKAKVISNINTVEKKVAICFEGTAEDWVVARILDSLEAHDMTATFFFSAVETSENEEAVKEIIKKGHEVESYTLYGTPHMEELSQEEVISDFCRAQAVYEDKLGKRPAIVKCNATDYTEMIMETADSCGYESVVYPTCYLNYSSFSNKKMVENYVASKGRGTIFMIKLSGFLDETEYQEKRKPEQEKPAEDKAPSLQLHKSEVEGLSEEERLLVIVEWLLEALEESEYRTIAAKDMPEQDMGDLVLKYEEQEEQYEEILAEIIKTVHTTDREMSFTFRGLGDEKELDNVLAAMEEKGITGTFFVTGKELDEFPEQVRKIIAAGHEIGNGGYSGKSMKEMSFGEICEDIYKTDLVLETFGVETDIFMPPYGGTTEEVQRAAAAMEKYLITYTSSPVRQEYVEAEYSAKKVVQNYYKSTKPVMCRGEIVYFNMAVYEDSDFIADLVKAVWDAKIRPTRYENSILQVCTISQLLDNTWWYPASTNGTYYAIANAGKMQYTWEQALGSGYIGNPYLDMTGFEEGEAALLDRTGRVNTGGSNTVFLTFDDWGNEQTIGQLLYVLKKHNVKASFFIKTQYVVDGTGENLLRAIAAEGHDVGSHTDSHMQINIAPEQVPVLQQDLVKSNQVLARVVGNTGRLTDYFRPPTLAINKTGLNTVWDCGYGHIINADISTGDYAVQSADQLYDILINGVTLDNGGRVKIQDGSIVVMHINTNSVHTPKALDKWLTYIEGLPAGDPGKFNFARLSDYIH